MDIFQKLRDLDLNESISIFIQPDPIKNEFPYTNEFTKISTNIFYDNTKAIHRTTLANEIVLDYDEKEFEKDNITIKYRESVLKNKELVINDLLKLDKHKYKYDVYFSGNKGFHVHFFINPIKNLLNKTQQKLIQKMDLKKVMVVLKKSILDSIGINIEKIDNAIIDQIYHNIRVEGSFHYTGQKYKYYLGSNLYEFKKNTKDIDELFIRTSNFDLKSISNNKYDDLNNGLDKNMIKIFMEKINEINSKEEENILIKYLKKGKYKNYNNIKNSELRPKVAELLTRKILDGRKKVLTIILSEMSSLEWEKEEIENKIDVWNNLGHSDGPLSQKYINGQINFFTNRKYNFWTYERIEKELENVDFF